VPLPFPVKKAYGEPDFTAVTIDFSKDSGGKNDG
jgi:hypothetical protein